MGHVLGKGRFAVGVAQRLRAGGPAPDPCSVFVSQSVTDRIERCAAREKCGKAIFTLKLVQFTKFTKI